MDTNSERCAQWLAIMLADGTIQAFRNPYPREWNNGLAYGYRLTAAHGLRHLFNGIHGYKRAKLAHIVRNAILRTLDRPDHRPI